jgi:DDE superfamily endonuclease
VIRRKNWCKKGSRKKITGQRRRGRINVMGGLRYSDRKRWVEFVNQGNSESFFEVLKLFYEEMIKEWIVAGNQREDFAKYGPKLVIILDNASFHKQAEMIKEIESEMPNIQLGVLQQFVKNTAISSENSIP